MLGLTAGVDEFEGSGPNREQSSRVQCVVDEYGPTDFTQSIPNRSSAADVLPQFLGGDLNRDRLAICAPALSMGEPECSTHSGHSRDSRYLRGL